MASYNWGEGRVINRLQKMPADPTQRNFWNLLRNYPEDVPDQTRDYVFRIVAAAVIGENPALFKIPIENPLKRFDPAAGAHLAGVLPHRNAGGEPLVTAGLNARAMLENPLKGYMLLGAIEPGLDVSAQAQKTLAASEFVVMLTPFATEEMRAFAHVLLPIGTFAETSGTFVNAEGLWQSFRGAAQPVGESRPAWKVLRVLGNLLDLGGFDYVTSEDVREELKGRVGESRPDAAFVAKRTLNGGHSQGVAADVPMYQIDAVVRRAPALQRTREAQQAAQRAEQR